MIRSWRLSLLGILAICVGCSSVNTTTTIRPDGSFTRKVVYKLKADQFFNLGPAAKNSKKDKLEDRFILPKPGAGIKISVTDNGQEATETVTREVASGSPSLTDVELCDSTHKVTATSNVHVYKDSAGRLHYDENFTSASPFPMEKGMSDSIRVRLKRILPKELETPANLDKLCSSVASTYIRVLFGPPEPMLVSPFGGEEAVMRRLNARAYPSLIEDFRAIGSSPEQSKRFARAFAKDPFDKNDSSSTKETQSGGESTLFFSVAFPGKIVETNGIVDPVTDEVYWSFLPETLAAGPVTLHLVVQP